MDFLDENFIGLAVKEAPDTNKTKSEGNCKI